MYFYLSGKKIKRDTMQWTQEAEFTVPWKYVYVCIDEAGRCMGEGKE